MIEHIIREIDERLRMLQPERTAGSPLENARIEGAINALEELRDLLASRTDTKH